MTDSSHSTGQIALYASSNVNAIFREVRVAYLQWNTYYSFDQEIIHSAGTRMQIFSGNAFDTPSPINNVSYRFVSTLNDPGLRHFTGDMADLRLVDLNGHVIHARRFFTKSVYSTLNAKVIRSADGTGLVVVVSSANAAGTQLNTGEYRVIFSYLRDNRGTLPTSQVFSENGSTDPEVTTIDIPWRKIP